MSAFIVCKKHIDVLVTAALDGDRRYGFSYHHNGHRYPVTAEGANDLGQMLWKTNHESVNARYNEDGEAETYRHTRVEATVVEVFKAIDGYEYQSCEHDGWKTSQARAFCDALRRAYTHKIAGYSDAPWAWGPDTISSKDRRPSSPKVVR